MRSKKPSWLTENKRMLIGIIAGGLITSFYYYLPSFSVIESSTTKPIMIGSGTVMNYLKKTVEDSCLNEAVFLSGPSGIAMDILLTTRDINKEQLPLISMSSTKYDIDSLMKKIKKYQEERRLLMIELAEDTLNIGFCILKKDSTSFNKYCNRQSAFYNLSDLRSMLEDDSLNFVLYITNPESGTREEYEKNLNVDKNYWDGLKEKRMVKIYDLEKYNKIDSSRNAVLLQSDFYCLKGIRHLPLIDDKRNVYIKRKLCLYLVEDNKTTIDLSKKIVTIGGTRDEYLKKLLSSLKEGTTISNWNILNDNNNIIELGF